MDKVFGPSSAKKALTTNEFNEVATDVFKIPKILVDMLFAKIEKVLEKVPNSGVIKQAGGNKLTREAV